MRRAIAVLAVLGLLTASCAAPAGRPARPRSTASADSPAASPTREPDTDAPAPVPGELRFEAPLLSGGTIDGRRYAGADLVIWFWAPW